LELIVPIQCEYYALEGLGQLLRNVSLVQKNINPNLQLTGIVMTMFDSRTKLSEQVVAEVKRYFGDRVYDVIIPRTIRLSEAPGFGQPITVYDPKSKGAQSYRRLAKEVDEKPPPSAPMPTMDHLPKVVIARSPDAEAPSEETPVHKETPMPAAQDAPRPQKSAPNPRSGREPKPATAKPVAQTPPKAVPQPAPTPVTRAPAAKTTPATRPARAPDRASSSRPVVQVPDSRRDDDDAASWLEELALEAETQVTPPSTSEVLAEAASRAEATGALGEDEIWESESAHTNEPVGHADTPAPRASGRPSSDRRVVVIEDDIDIPVSAPAAQAPQGEPRTAGAQVGATLEDEESPKKRWRLFRKGGE
jgi:hypothetical protein